MRPNKSRLNKTTSQANSEGLSVVSFLTFAGSGTLFVKVLIPSWQSISSLSAKVPSLLAMSANEFLSSSGHLPMTYRDRERLICAFRIAAQEQDLSSKVTDRYQAWAWVFLSWCFNPPVRPINATQIGSFRKALCEAEASKEQVREAMDALGFFFGAVNQLDDILSMAAPTESMAPSTGACETRTSGSGKGECGEIGPGEDVGTLSLGWRGEDGSTSVENVRESSSPPTYHLPSSGLPEGNRKGLSEDESPREKPSGQKSPKESNVGNTDTNFSTAELCVRRYQKQVESLHESESTPTAR